jgi:hypothetical protein
MSAMKQKEQDEEIRKSKAVAQIDEKMMDIRCVWWIKMF